jgi:type II secretory pathway pseudopilin PulG
MKPPGKKALTLTEALVALVILVVLFAILSVPRGPGNLASGQMTQTLSNMRQLNLATQTAALDGTTTGDTNLGWPGDVGGTFSNWAHMLVESNYLQAEDLAKLLSAPGIQVKPGTIPSSNTTAIRIYGVKEKSGDETVFLTSANFTNTPSGGVAPLPGAKPYGTNGFVVFRKGGDGVILKAAQAGNTNLIGSFAPLCE